MSLKVETFSPGDQVQHEELGLGRVEFDKGLTALVRFESGIEECEKATLKRIHTPLQVLEEESWHAPLEVITRVQAEAIQSANDMWGVFSQSRIELLPHQLWVCRRVLDTWPARWLVADDVGLFASRISPDPAIAAFSARFALSHLGHGGPPGGIVPLRSRSSLPSSRGE